jgi:hypothetical protein
MIQIRLFYPLLKITRLLRCAALSTDPPPFDDRRSPSYPIAGIYGTSSLMGATCSDRCAKGRESQSVSATIANARSPARWGMA